MKKYLLVLWSLSFSVFCFSPHILAQGRAPSNGKAPIKHRLPNVNFIHTPSVSIQQGDLAYCWEAFSSNLISMPLPAGNPWTTISAWYPPAGYSSSAIRGEDWNYYFIDPSVPSSIWQFDPNEGTITQMATISGMESGANVNGLAYDQVNHTYYICGGVFGVTNKLYTLDIYTGAAQLVSSFTNTFGAMIGIAINSSGEGFGYDIIDDNAYTFDPVSGTSSLLGPIGFDANYAQDMDIDQATGTIYLAAFNNTTFTAQLRTMDPTSGATTLLHDWGDAEVCAFAINNFIYFPPPPSAINPDPPNGAINVDINTQLSWSLFGTWNPISVEVFFGTSPDSLVSVYSGVPISTWDPGTLESYTNYYWKIVATYSTGTGSGDIWHFKTIQFLPPGTYIDEHFDDLNNWSIIGSGQTNWLSVNSDNAGGTAPELEFSWTPSFTGDSYFMCNNVFTGHAGEGMHLVFKQYENWYTDPYDLKVGITSDGGMTWTTIYDHPSNGQSNGPDTVNITFTAVDSMQIAFWFSGYSFNINYWYIDDVILSSAIPVEMISFTANVNQKNVELSWSTASETNNRGFEIEKLKDSKIEKLKDWEKVGFVNGNGTTSKQNFYSFIDNNFSNGTYSYRLKQIDFDGSFKYSKEVQVDVKVPAVFSLEQNYPNPFNPSTEIKFSLVSDSKVKLDIYNVLGQLVEEVLNSNLSSGEHTVNFNGSNLTSGVYFYRLEAQGNNGKNFNSIKKMILMK